VRFRPEADDVGRLAWSPSGKWLAFEVIDRHGNVDLQLAQVGNLVTSKEKAPSSAPIPYWRDPAEATPPEPQPSLPVPIPRDAVRLGWQAFGEPILRMYERPFFGPGEVLLFDRSVNDDLPEITYFAPEGASPMGWKFDTAPAFGAWLTYDGAADRVLYVGSDDMRSLRGWSPGDGDPHDVYASSAPLAHPSVARGGAEIALEAGGRLVVVTSAGERVGYPDVPCRSPVHAGERVLCFVADADIGAWDLVAVEPSGAIVALARSVALPLDARSAWAAEAGVFAVAVADPEDHGRIALVRPATGETTILRTGAWDVRDIAVVPAYRSRAEPALAVAYAGRLRPDQPRGVYLTASAL
jgi:hypothetical protein